MTKLSDTDKKLSKTEKDAVNKMRNSEPFDCRDGMTDGGYGVPTSEDASNEAFVIRACVIRAIALGIPLEGEGEPAEGEKEPAEDKKEPAEGGKERYWDPPRSIELRHAVVQGELDLCNVRGNDGGAGPAISLIACRITNSVRLSDGHFGRLSLKQSQFVDLIGDQMVIDGSVDLSDTGTAEADDHGLTGCQGKGRCSVDLAGSTIKGSLVAARAHLCCQELREDYDQSELDGAYALRMLGANVFGSLVLQTDFVAIGGVTLFAARVGGNVLMQGAQLTAEWDQALDMLHARVERTVALSGRFEGAKPKRFVADGGVRLYGARIDGELYMAGAELRGRKKDSCTLHAAMARIGDLVRLSAKKPLGRDNAVGVDDEAQSIRFEVKGAVDFSQATLGGFEAEDALFDACDAQMALNFTRARIRGDLRLKQAKIAATEEAVGAKGIDVHGSVEIEDVGYCGSLGLYGAKIGHDLVIDRMSPEKAGSGDINVAQTTIRGKLDIGSATVNGSLKASFARIRESATLAGIEVISSSGAFDARGLRVAGDLRLQNITVRGADAICFSMAGIKGVTDIDGLTIQPSDSGRAREVLFRNACFHGGLRLGQTEEDGRKQKAFSLLSARGVEQKNYLVVQLANAYAAYLEDDFGDGWGKNVKLGLGGFTYDQIDRVTLNGRRVERPAAERTIWLRRQFDGAEPIQSTEFDPQPHAQLARVYRQIGRTDDAREITYDKLKIEAKLGVRQYYRNLKRLGFARDWLSANKRSGVAVDAAALGVLVVCCVSAYHWPTQTAEWVIGVLLGALILPAVLYLSFRYGFGYGLYSRRAIGTFLVFLFVGWGGVEVALPNAMMLDTVTVNDAVMQESGTPPRLVPAMRAYSEEGIAQIPCLDSIEPLLYAADVFLPLIDLRQESRCSPTGGDHALWWQRAKALYAFLGWIVTSLTILTVTGVLRSRSEN